MALELRHVLIVTAVTPAVADPETEAGVTDENQTDGSGPRIRCPLCGWVPRRHDRWVCACGHYWNTFDTGGVCPACLHQWMTTQCLAMVCRGWSPHSDRYECG
jgi:hypothetical protein